MGTRSRRSDGASIVGFERLGESRRTDSRRDDDSSNQLFHGGTSPLLMMTRCVCNIAFQKNNLSPICAAPVTVMVLRVGDPAKAMAGADVGWPSWRLLQRHRDRLLLLGLRCSGEIV